MRAVEIIFFAMWLLCGCSIETVFDDWRSCTIFVIALIVTVVTAAVIARGDE